MTEQSTAPRLAIEDFAEGENASESEQQNQLEVVFSPDSTHRRKSSLVSSDDPRIRRRRKSFIHDRNTACFVHSLLSGEWAAPSESSIDDIEELARDLPDAGLSGVPEKARGKVSDTEQVSVVDFANQNAGQAAPTAVHSRHLTKKQLSDMAWNVRKLSRRLGSIKLKLTVKTVFVVTKVHDESLIRLTREMVQWLLSPERDYPYTVYVENIMRDHPQFDSAGLLEEEPTAKDRLKYWDAALAAEKPQTFDFVITLGGDGTVLYTSWLFQRIVPPVLTFSLGSLGFLTKFNFSNYQDILTSAFRDGVIISLRLRFECTVMRSNPRRKPQIDENGNPKKNDLVEELVGEEVGDSLTHTPDKVFEILNDVVVDRGPNPTMSTIELFGDDEHFTTVQADGVVISTPTGSTAYNLAAGGSLSHPENPVILVTAICAHTLSFRPIILPDTMVLRMGVPYDARTTSWASFDGRERVELHPGDYVTVAASRYPFANVMPSGRRSEDWVKSISRTLNWNSRQKQKAFK
ncbi:hypothetical protein VTN31DRAFT_4419 [Thermomyces dupontii]|uniref:uncharacterized protein n=1 Tax=Talaromyces thermophilus TaxID=28565 RepID=UPI00374397AE